MWWHLFVLVIRKNMILLERKRLLLSTSTDLAVVGATTSAINVGMVAAEKKHGGNSELNAKS